MSTDHKITIDLELTQNEAQVIIDAVQDFVFKDEVECGEVFTSESYRRAANAVVNALRTVGLNGDYL